MSGLGIVSFFMLLYRVLSMLFGGGVPAIGGVGGPLCVYLAFFSGGLPEWGHLRT